MPVLLSKQQMQALDRFAIDSIGIPALTLMEVAGRAVADAAEPLARAGGRVIAAAGLGNNGGDAVVAARHLRDRGFEVTLVLIGRADRASPDLAAELAIAARLDLVPQVVDDDGAFAAFARDLAGHAVAIDGLFGTGLSRPVTGLEARVLDLLDHAKLSVVAVDIPSGIDADTGRVLGTALHADVTVTFQHAKLGHLLHPGRAYAGRLVVADIGIPRCLLARVGPCASTIESEELRDALPLRRADTHKGTYGHLLVVAGARDRPGAALLAGRAGLRTGAGLVTIASDEETIRRIAPALDELMGHSAGISDRIDARSVLEALESRNALAIGPSLTAGPELAALLREVLSQARVPAVVDASALGALGADLDWLKARGYPTILTPHPGEMARLSGLDVREVQADRIGVATAVARASGAHVVLKGASTVVASPDGEAGVITRGNPGMATGGAGDVLTGVIGGLLAQGAGARSAARAGALLHAAAGDIAGARGQGRLIASDIIAALSEASAELRGEASRR